MKVEILIICDLVLGQPRDGTGEGARKLEPGGRREEPGVIPTQTTGGRKEPEGLAEREKRHNGAGGTRGKREKRRGGGVRNKRDSWLSWKKREGRTED